MKTFLVILLSPLTMIGQGSLTIPGPIYLTNALFGVSPPTDAVVNFGTNVTALEHVGSQSGASTNLGFFRAQSSTLFDVTDAPDEVSTWGYNFNGGSRVFQNANWNTTATGFAIEGNYNQPGGKKSTEVHLMFVDTTNHQNRIWSYEINKQDTNDWVHYNTLSGDSWYWPSPGGSQVPYFSVSGTQLRFLPRTAKQDGSFGIAFSQDSSTNMFISNVSGTTVPLLFSGWSQVSLPPSALFSQNNVDMSSSHLVVLPNNQRFDSTNVSLSVSSSIALTANSFVDHVTPNVYFETASEGLAKFASGGFLLCKNSPIKFCPETSVVGTPDSGVCRVWPGLVRITQGATNTTGQLVTQWPTATGSAITLSVTNSYYLCNVDGQTITLPTAVGNSGQVYTIKLIAPSTTGTVATTSSQLIDGASTYSLSASNKFAKVLSDNTNWWVVGSN